MSILLASGVIKFSDGTNDYAEVHLVNNEISKFITIGVGSGGFNGMSVQLTPIEFVSGHYDDVIFGLKLFWLLRLIDKTGPEIIKPSQIIECYNSLNIKVS